MEKISTNPPDLAEKPLLVLSAELENKPKANIPPVFRHCMCYLSKAVEFLAENEHPDALKLGLIRLRLSRWYAQIIKGDGLIPPEDEHAVVRELDGLYSMVGDVYAATRGGLPRQELLKAIDGLVAVRLKGLIIPEPKPEYLYRGNIIWSPRQYRRAAEILGNLEQFTGAQRLRDMSAEDLRDIDPKRAYSTALNSAAAEVDPWLRAVFVGSQITSGLSSTDSRGGSQDQNTSCYNPKRIYHGIRESLHGFHNSRPTNRGLHTGECAPGQASPQPINGALYPHSYALSRTGPEPTDACIVIATLPMEPASVLQTNPTQRSSLGE